MGIDYVSMTRRCYEHSSDGHYVCQHCPSLLPSRTTIATGQVRPMATMKSPRVATVVVCSSVISNNVYEGELDQNCVMFDVHNR
jgi:hypothetical protein